MEENIEFLNKQREENKQGKIKILNDKTIEDIKLLKELKKAGVNKAIIQEKINEVDEVNDIETADDIYNDDAIFDNGKNKEDNYNVLNDIMTNEVKNDLGEDNDILMTYDRDDDDEYMENEDKGFIYN
jgi:tagatose-1,6-bisphosphate aldolase